MSAIISDCGLFRYRLEREAYGSLIADHLDETFGKLPVFAYFGVNPSTADAALDDQTTKKWAGFTLRNGGRRYIAGNVFAFRSTAVGLLASVPDPVGPCNFGHLCRIIADADVLVPCWGSRTKIPKSLHHHLDALRDLLWACNRPVKVFGLTASGDPKHVMMLGYNTPLVDWVRP